MDIQDDDMLALISDNFMEISKSLETHRDYMKFLGDGMKVQAQAIITLQNKEMLIFRLVVPICILFSLVGMIAGLFALFG